jgi:hypothetical protein
VCEKIFAGDRCDQLARIGVCRCQQRYCLRRLTLEGVKRGNLNRAERVLMILIDRGFGLMAVGALARTLINGSERSDAPALASAIATTANAQTSRARSDITSPRRARP